MILPGVPIPFHHSEVTTAWNPPPYLRQIVSFWSDPHFLYLRQTFTLYAIGVL